MVPHHLVASLATTADTAIDNVLRVGAPGQSKPTGEVGFVAAVVIGGVHDIANAWSPLLHPHGLSVKMGGVFCHQTPRATFANNSGKIVSCELADLLVVVEDNTGGRPGRRWAALIQAKMAAPGGGQTLTQPADLRQLDLMSGGHRSRYQKTLRLARATSQHAGITERRLIVAATGLSKGSPARFGISRRPRL